MALIFFDSPKKYAALSSQNGITVHDTAGVSINAATGRNSEPGWVLASSGTFPRSIVWSFTGQAMGVTLYAGRHFRKVGASNSVHEFMYGAAAGANNHGNSIWKLRVLADNTIQFGTGNFTVRATSTLQITQDADHFIEIAILLATTAIGSVLVKVDGVDFIGGESGVNGDNIITASVSTAIACLGIASGTTTGHTNVCDVVYLCNGSGAAPWNTLLGNVKTRWCPAAADTTQKDFTPNSGTNNYSRVGDTTDDGDTTYNVSDTDGHADEFVHANGIVSSNVLGWKAYARVRKETTGAMGMKLRMRSGGTLTKSALFTPPTSYQSYHIIGGPDPDTGLQITADAANAARPGYENSTTV